MENGIVKSTVEIEAYDIPTMMEMSPEGYAGYLEELFFTDHHGIFRSNRGEYPLATSRDQLEILIAYLRNQVAPKLER